MEWKEVLEYTEKSLALNEKSAKVWYRRAEAFTHRKEYDEALDALGKAKDLEPNDKACLDDERCISKQHV